MLNSIKITVLSAILFLSLTQIGRADMPSLAPPFSIDSFSVTHGASPAPGDTIQLIIHVRSFVSGLASLRLNFPNSVAPPDRDSGQTQSDSAITVDSGSSYNYSISLKLFAYGGSMVETSLLASTAPPGFQYSVSSHINFDLSSSGLTFSVPWTAQTNDTASLVAENLFNGGGIFHISGKLTYVDQNQTDLTYPNGIPKGVYGDTVILVFTKSGVISSDITNETHFYQPDDGCTLGVDFDTVDVNGNFSFNTTTGPYSWAEQGYVDAVVLVVTGNQATHVVGGVGDGQYPISTLTLHPYDLGCSRGPWETFQSPVLAIIPITNGFDIESTTANISNMPFEVGCVLRNEEFAQEFDRVRGIGVTPPQVLTLFQFQSSGEAGNFNKSPFPPAPYLLTADHINIYTQSTPTDHHIDHEWGHYAQWALQGYSYGSATSWLLDPDLTDTSCQAWGNFIEGFAEFHQFAVRNYVNTNYGDISDWTGVGDPTDVSGNCEEGPFKSPRFTGIYFGDATVGARACFNWNVYDGYTDPGFKASQYANADNDDIGFPGLIFSYLYGNTGTTTLYGSSSGTTGYYHYIDSNLTANGLSAAWPSVMDIEQCMLGNGTTLMRPAQVTGLGGSEVEGGCGGEAPMPYQASLSWSLQDYPSGAYINLEDGIHVYLYNEITSTWDLNQTLSAGTTSTTVCLPTFQANFMVSSFRTYSGSLDSDSYNAPTIYVSTEGGFKIADGHSQTDTGGIAVTVHPNPSSLTTRICVEDLPEGVPATVEIVDVMGQPVTTLYNATPEAELGLCMSLDCSRMPSGTYYARVVNDIMGTTVKFSVEH